jgi:non-lysosomal glucosylceramidase
MRMVVGGGRDDERLRVSMLVEGRRVFSATGTFFETLGRREWNIAPYKGKQAQIEIVDEAKGAWGHILVDEIVQWVGTSNADGKL